MALSVDNFEQVVEPVILQRGRSYFRSGCVTKCVEDEVGEVQAEVVGSKRYKVTMDICDDGTIGYHRCTCPYDWGEVCKHEVAVLYYLREQRKKTARKAKVTDVVEELKSRAKDIKAKAESGETREESKEVREAQNKLTDEAFAMLPKDELDKHIMALSLMHDGIVRTGYLTRISKNAQVSSEQVHKQLMILCQKGNLQRGNYYEEYPLNPLYAIPLAMYILDRHPEWLAAELPNSLMIKRKQDMAFWTICRALYNGDTDKLRSLHGSFDWLHFGSEALLVAFFQPLYEPLFYTADDAALFDAAKATLNRMELLEIVNEEKLQQVRHGVDTYRSSASSSDTEFEDYFAALRFLSGGSLPLPQKTSTHWFYIAHAISAMRQGQWEQSGQLFESALKLRNKKAKDKNLFYDPIANYYLMVYYAKVGSEETKKKAQQFLKKDTSRDTTQLPAYVVAKYVVLNDDDGNRLWFIELMLSSKIPLLWAFARLFADYFKEDIGNVKPTNIALLQDEPVLFSIHVKSRWEKALDELMMIQDNQTEMPTAPKKQERLAYVIWPLEGRIRGIWPQKQKLCNDGSWSKPYNVSAQTYFTTGYDFMDDIDRQIFERLRKTVGHTKYYYRPNWGTLEDYLPFLIGTDKVYLRKSDYDYEPVSVRKERAYLSIERTKEKLVFSSNIQMRQNEFALGSIRIVEESPTSYVVMELSPYERKAYETLLVLGSVPIEAEERIKQFLSAASGLLEIHSDLIEGGSTLEKVEGDTTIVLRIAPKKGEFTLECCVQPLTGGKLRFFPGEGKATIFDEKEGTRYQVERDLAIEQERLQSLNEFCSERLHILLSAEPQMIAIEDVLMLMEFVGNDAEKFAIEWQDGAKLSIKEPVQTESYSMGLRTRENWFEVEGELQLDEKTILSAAELLRLMQGNMVGKRFVRLNGSEFIALNERLAKQLNRVQQIAQINRNRVLIPRFEIGLLGELLAHPDTILRQDEGVRELLHKIDQAATMAIPVPKNLQATLRDYQEDGFKWMMRLAEWGAGACLADDMGLGKTVQTIAVLLAKADKGASLVVAPASVVYNWQSELQRFAPLLHVHVLNEADNRKKLIKALGPNDVLLTTYGLLVREEKALTDKAWNVVCLDEAHTIKNRATKMSQAAMCLRADMRITLTGTPLQNYLSELWNLSQFINPGLLGSFESFSHDFITPIEAEHNKERQKLLRKILQPFLLRRTKAEVIDELPEKTEITRRIELTPEERVAYEAMRIEAQQQVAQASKVDMNVLASITRLRQAACSLELVENCASLSSDGGSKLADFAELISQIVTGGNRVLVFSQFTSFLQMAMNAINSEANKLTNGEAYKLLYLDGGTPLNKRKQMVEAFQRGEAQVFFISLKAGGLGLNLTEANYVIHLDPWWNPAIEQQATDRAYRIGQKRNVTVYHLIAADTIEEKILRLHKTKRDLADALLQDQNTTHALTLSDLKELLSATHK